MGSKSDIRRRWLGGFFLGAALIMLFAGETVLRNRLGRFAFVLFWLVCFAFTGLAIVMAFIDASALRRRLRAEQRALLEQTLQEIARRQDSEPGQPPARPDDSH